MNPYPEKIYLNGEILNAEEAKISVFDRGFLFGDGIYEVMAKIEGRFFYEKLHWDRLNYCLKEINIDFDISVLQKDVHQLLEASNLLEKDCLLYIQVTRGVAPRKHAFPDNTTPTFMMYALQKTLPGINQVHASVITLNDYRWSRCDIKMTSLLGNVMANDFAIKQDYFEAILIRDGIITEASHCNVFFVKDNIVYTHPTNNYILDGITRQIVLKLCKELNIEVREQGITQSSITDMDEAFLTGTTTQIASIKQINQHLFYNNDDIGAVTFKLQQAFLKLKKNTNNIH